MASPSIDDGSIAPAPPPEDITVKMLDGLFGAGWPNYFNLHAPTGFTGVFFDLLSAMNMVALSAVAVISVYSVLVGVTNAAYEGRAFGQRFNTVWAPLRWSFSIFLLFPLPAVKISVLQAFILASTYWGIGLADKLWSQAVELMATSSGHVTISAVPPPLGQTMGGVLRSLTAQYYSQVQLGHAGGGMACSVVDYDSGRGQIERIGTPLERDASESMFVSFYTAYRTMWDDIDLGPAHAGWGQPGTWRCTFTVPQGATQDGGYIARAWRGLTAADDLGYVEIYCPEGVASPVCETKVRGFQDIVVRLSPTAQSIASLIGDAEPPELNIEPIAQMEEAYRLQVRRVLEELLRDSDTKYGQSLRNFSSTAQRYGWGMAGSWYWTMSRFNDAVNSAAENYPIWNAGDLPDYVQSYQDLAGYLGSAANLADKAALAMTSPSTRYTRRSIEQVAAGPDTYSYFMRPLLALEFADILTANEDPLISMQSCGEFLLSAANAVLVAQVAYKAAENTMGGEVLTFAAEKFTGFGALISAGAEVYGPYISAMLAGAIVVGMVFAVYLPMVPWIMWTIGQVGWLVVVGESLIAAPLWAATHALPEGEGLTGGHARRGYMLFLGVLLRPPLMVIGFFFSIAMMHVVGQVLTLGIHAAAAGLRAGNTSGLFTFVALLAVIGGLLVATVHKIFGIVTWVPEQVMRWIQGDGHVLGEQQAESHTRSIFGTVIQSAGAHARRAVSAATAGHPREDVATAASHAAGEGELLSKAGGTSAATNADLAPGAASSLGGAVDSSAGLATVATVAGSRSGAIGLGSKDRDG
jgi:conjugal transfer/type IV secretion protein DotA/TraY